jgi:molybdopterin/thiamine biosynthesis adenylyltransferase/nitroreductase
VFSFSHTLKLNKHMTSYRLSVQLRVIRQNAITFDEAFDEFNAMINSMFEPPKFHYEDAFSRNLGLVSESEQARLRQCCVALPGLGGVGGAHLQALARLGVGGFHLADPDIFEVVNFNRQLGAALPTCGRRKIDVSAETLRSINPEARIKVFPEGISTSNIDAFLQGVDVVVDGIEFFCIEARRLLYAACREKGISVVNAGPIGYGAAVMVFTAKSMSFEEFFRIDNQMTRAEQLIAFGAGLTPGIRGDVDPSRVDFEAQKGPALVSACLLCAATAATEVLKLVCGRGRPAIVPHGLYYDPYRGRILRLRPRPSLTRSLRGRILRRIVFRRFPALHLLHKRELERRRSAAIEAAPKTTGPIQKQGIGGVGAQDPMLEKLIAAAICAPSGDNTQPWRFVLHQELKRITVYVDEARDPSPMNAGQRMSRIACGAAVENLFRQARASGWEAGLEEGADGALAMISLKQRGEDRPLDRRVAETITNRVVNRRVYDGRPVDGEVLERLKRETPMLQGIRTHWICGRDMLSRLANVIAQADEIMYAEKPLRAAVMSHIRFDAAYDAEVEEGLSVASLEASAAERFGMRTMFRGPDWLFKLSGARRLLALRARTLVESSSGLCVVAMPDVGGTSQLDLLVGRAMQCAWLALHEEGLAVQPMMSLLVLANILEHGSDELIDSIGRAKVLALMNDFRRSIPEIGPGPPAFLMRFGFAPAPSGRTGRRPLTAVATEGPP